MKLEVHIKDKIFTVHCGEGKQRIQWIADASVVRYEHFSGGTCPVPMAVRLEDGTQLDLQSIIKDSLPDGANLWILFKEDLEALGLLSKPKKHAQAMKNLHTMQSP